MNIHLKKASIQDSEKIHKMQVMSFKPLLEKYKDYDTNPGAETLERVKLRFDFNDTDHFLICLYKENIGYIRIRRLYKNHTYMLSQMFIIPGEQGKGYAQAAIRQAEMLYPKDAKWTLDTIKQEPKLSHLYEKMGYRLTGTEKQIKEGMDLVYYEK